MPVKKEEGQVIAVEGNGLAELVPAMVPKGIAKKLVRILEAAGKVEKKGTNRAQNYKFVRETDLVDMIRPIMAEVGLFLNLDVVDHDLVELYKTSSGNTMRLTILTIRGTWVDSETGDVWPLPSTFIGYGGDTGDKGVYKAMTGAEKYFLFKSFLVGTGDDPEGDERTDRAGAGSGPVRVNRQRPNGAPRGGRQAGASGPQINAVIRLVRETGLTPEAFRRLVAKETGIAVAEDTKLGGADGWIAQQTGGVVGKIIGALTELASEAPGTARAESGEVEDEGIEDGGGESSEDDDLPL